MYMFPPLIFVAFLVLLLAYTKARRTKSVSAFVRQGGPTSEVLTHPCVIFYVFLLLLCMNVDWVYSMGSVFGLLDPRITVLHSEAWDDHKDLPKAFCVAMREALCKSTMCRGDNCSIQVDEACVQQYPDPCDIVVVPHILRWVMLLSPPCVILALMLAMWHSLKHMRFGRPWVDEELDIMHSFSIQICGLAPVYGIFSLMSVVHMVSLFECRTDTLLWKSDHHCDHLLTVKGIHGVPQQCWADFIERSERWYNLNFLVADLYEARVLYCFGTLCMEYIELQRRKRGLLSHSCPECQFQCPRCKGDNLAISQVLLAPLRAMTLQGLQFFVWTNYFRSVLMIALEVLRMNAPETWNYVNDSMYQMGATDAVWQGFTFCVSSIAIWNLVTFESHLSQQLHGFKPKLKFLSAKIIVSLAFLQEIVLKIVCHGKDWRPYQVNLAYASLMSVEILFVAILQYLAWKPCEVETLVALSRETSVRLHPDTQQVEFLITRGENRLKVSVAEQSVQPQGCGEEQAFWQSASVTLLS